MLDRAIAAVSPKWGARRAFHRMRLTRLYEAASIGHPQHRDPLSRGASADGTMNHARGNVRDWARYLDENYDIAVGVCNQLVVATIGGGLIFEPQVRDRAGELLSEHNRRIRQEWRAWYERPEVSRELTGPEAERLCALSWVRDGEVFIHHLEGAIPGLVHATAVPYSLELLEADLLPWDLLDDQRGPAVVHGIERDRWRRVIAYHFYRAHPGDATFGALGRTLWPDTVRVPAHQITHLKWTRRLGQSRGISALHAVAHRLDSLRDLDESELIAARVAASLTAVITRDADVDDAPQLDATTGSRSFQMQPGLIADVLGPGEGVETIESSRPNPDLIEYRHDQQRAVAAGTGTRASAVSKRYEGSYSSQRQELVEAEPLEAHPRRQFCSAYGCAIFERWIRLAYAAGVIPVPRAADPATLFDVEVRPGGGTPWISPLEEVRADVAAIDAGLASRRGTIRRRGGDPELIDREIEADPKRAPALPTTESTDDEAA